MLFGLPMKYLSAAMTLISLAGVLVMICKPPFWFQMTFSAVWITFGVIVLVGALKLRAR